METHQCQSSLSASSETWKSWLQSREALPHFLKADEYPESFSVGRPKNDPRGPRLAYGTDMAYAALGERDNKAVHSNTIQAQCPFL